MSMSNRIQQYIVQCDPGFVRMDGENYVLNREDDEGNETVVTMTPDEYSETHPATTAEEFFAVLHLAVSDMSGKHFVTTTETVDTLLDLRTLFVQVQEESKQSIRRLYTLWSEAVS
jgi:hypothetical protein